MIIFEVPINVYGAKRWTNEAVTLATVAARESEMFSS